MEVLREWFLASRRTFPWRSNPTPYRVWVSEVMLQQTRASVVVAYFERWMERFPTIAELAKSPVQEVIKQWEGLGYYSRARNLHAGAQMIVERFHGSLPRSASDLAGIPGVGPYTLRAIRAFAFHERAAPVDGNVRRVLSRYYGQEFSPAELASRAEGLLPSTAPWEIAEALIELGATVCTRSPVCAACPLRRSCQAYATGRQTQLPASRSQSITHLKRTVAVISNGESVLLRCPAPGRIMADLYEFPYSEESLPHLLSQLSVTPDAISLLSPVTHTFTRYRAVLVPHYCTIVGSPSVQGHSWKPLTSLSSLPFSAGHRRILAQLLRAHSRAV